MMLVKIKQGVTLRPEKLQVERTITSLMLDFATGILSTTKTFFTIIQTLYTILWTHLEINNFAVAIL